MKLSVIMKAFQNLVIDGLSWSLVYLVMVEVLLYLIRSYSQGTNGQNVMNDVVYNTSSNQKAYNASQRRKTKRQVEDERIFSLLEESYVL